MRERLRDGLKIALLIAIGGAAWLLLPAPTAKQEMLKRALCDRPLPATCTVGAQYLILECGQLPEKLIGTTYSCVAENTWQRNQQEAER